MHHVFTTALEDKARFRVCRLDLLPLTLGHLFVLREYDSPFVAREKKEKSFGDVLIAAFTCSQHHARSRSDLSNARMTRYISRWGRACRGLDLAHEAQTFYRYLQHYFACPSTENREFRKLETPEEWTLLAMLMGDFGLSESEALEKTVPWATALWCAQAERTGKAKFVNTDQNWAAYVARAVQHQRKIDLAMREASAAAKN